MAMILPRRQMSEYLYSPGNASSVYAAVVSLHLLVGSLDLVMHSTVMSAQQWLDEHRKKYDTLQLGKLRITGISWVINSYWPEQRVCMMTSWHGNDLRIIVPLWGDSFHQSLADSHHSSPIKRSFDVYIAVNPNKLLYKLSSCRWFETP